MLYKLNTWLIDMASCYKKMARASVLEVRIAEAAIKQSVGALNRPARGLQVQNSCIVTDRDCCQK